MPILFKLKEAACSLMQAAKTSSNPLFAIWKSAGFLLRQSG
jgi:hypothetical protein